MQRLYFGGSFPKLDKNDPEGSMKGDFRALVLGDVKRMLYSPQDGSMEVPLSDSVSYVGPYYYYDGMLKAHTLLTQTIDGINLKNRVIDNYTTHYNHSYH